MLKLSKRKSIAADFAFLPWTAGSFSRFRFQFQRHVPKHQIQKALVLPSNSASVHWNWATTFNRMNFILQIFKLRPAQNKQSPVPAGNWKLATDNNLRELQKTACFLVKKYLCAICMCGVLIPGGKSGKDRNNTSLKASIFVAKNPDKKQS